MIVFNGGPDSREGNSHAALAFVASGHVLFLDTETREPVECIDAGTQAHAVWPTPDQRHLLVANQNGKLFQRIATDYDNERFTLEDEATLDLANGTTPSGALRQDPGSLPVGRRPHRQRHDGRRHPSRRGGRAVLAGR